jgi:hypothetical protein
LLLAASPLVAQQGGKRPEGWKTRFDRPAPDSLLRFESMEPGWHITSGPSGILYDPSRTAEGNFRVESEIFLFPSPPREAFGIFIGGENLDAPNQSYLYFLIRGDGRYLVKRRAGSETHELVPWTANEAIVKPDGGKGTAKNVLAIEAGAEKVRFLINGEEVTSLPRSEVDAEGIVGLRVNHNLDVHVSSLKVEPQ